ncbi:hypothetical protein [Flexivirga alba]|uniref:Winged helix DNA-binding domain-containing protein n=1 Tax=Flexivirga alba TaxID=702742 RepID=A0ABW2AHC7_9MICO
MSVAPSDPNLTVAELEAHRRERSEHVMRLRTLVRSVSAARLAAFELSVGDGPGQLVRLRQAAYTSGIGDLGPEDVLIVKACMVQQAAARPLVFSRGTSEAVWAAPAIGTRTELVEYVMPPGARGRSADVRRRRTGLLPEYVEIGGLLVTAYERMVVDHTRQARLASGISVCDNALHLGLTTREALLAEHDKVPKGRRGRSMAQLAIHLADARAESPLESLSRTRMFQASLPMPDLQKRFYDRDEFIGRTDFYWPTLGLVGECDGDLKYAVSQEDSGQIAVDALMQEKNREERLRRHSDVDDIARWNWAEALAPGRLHEVLGAHHLRSVLVGGWPVPDGPLPKRAFVC